MSSTSSAAPTLSVAAHPSTATATATPTSPKVAWTGRVVTYNILSSILATPDHHHLSSPDHLALDHRHATLTQKLIPELRRGSILCLQEVSSEWLKRLTPLWAAENYTCLSTGYGKNAWGGLIIAFPTRRYKAVRHQHQCIADLISDPDTWSWWRKRGTVDPYGDLHPRATLAHLLASMLLGICIALLWIESLARRVLLEAARRCRRPPALASILGQRWGASWETKHVAWEMAVWARHRQWWRNSPWNTPWRRASEPANRILGVHLTDQDHDQLSLCVVNYHMPCKYWDPLVMDLHAYVAMRCADELARNMPLVLAGDWNVKPSDPLYRRMTFSEGFPRALGTAFRGKRFTRGRYGRRLARNSNSSLDEADSDSASKPGSAGKDSLHDMRMLWSAAVQCHGREPAFTCLAAPGPGKPVSEAFCDTLDYIFLSRDLECARFEILASPGVVQRRGVAALPSADEPSDHVMLAADLVFVDRGQI
jgi:hypothetical protein